MNGTISGKYYSLFSLYIGKNVSFRDALKLPTVVAKGMVNT